MHEDAIGTVIVGDMNVHNIRWLRYSTHNSAEGSALHEFCKRNGLSQLVSEPTRKDNLLDLVISDIDSVSKCKVLPQIADHNAVLFETKFSIPVSQFSSRLLWDYSKADWAGLQGHFSSLDWSWIDDLEPNDAAVRITNIILDSAHKFIPSNSKGTFKSTHPWINSRCVQLVQAKVEAEGTPLYRETFLYCCI